MICIVLLIAASLLSSPAQAIPCWAVKKAVAQYGEAAVESWARAKGISDKEIEKARRCLKQGHLLPLPLSQPIGVPNE